MSPSDIAALTSLVDRGGVTAVLIAVIAALGFAVRWLGKLVLDAKDGAISYRDEQITALRGQLVRQQDLFDRAMEVIREGSPGRRR